MNHKEVAEKCAQIVRSCDTPYPNWGERREMIAMAIEDYAATLRPTPPTTKPSGDPVAEYLRGGCNTVPQECVSADCERTGVCQWPQPTSKGPEPCSIEGMIASERRREEPK